MRFLRPSYTFTESGVVGTVEVVKSGVASADFCVRVSGGQLHIIVMIILKQTQLHMYTNPHRDPMIMYTLYCVHCICTLTMYTCTCLQLGLR